MNLTYMKQQLTTLLAYRGCDKFNFDQASKTFILKQAHELVEHIFTFDKPWDMERCTTPYQLPQTIDWNVKNHQDEEWTFMLNRMDYINYLIQAYMLEGKDLYLDTCKDLILQWIHAHKTLIPSPSNRTLDSAIRISNILDAISYLYHYQAISDDELDVIATYMYAQIQYLHEQYIPKYTLSNWGTIQTCVIISCLPIIVSNYKEDPIFLWAKQELKTQVSIQVYPDGMFWEQSTMYHIEVLHYLMKTIFMNRIFLLKISKTIYEKAFALADALSLQVTPSLAIEAFGDSDACCVSDVFTRAAYIFKNPCFKYIATATFDHESAYIFGSNPAHMFQTLACEEDSRLIYNGDDSGMYSVRSSWQPDASYTMFTNGSLGSGHGHCDNLHFSVYYQDKPFFIDTGRYTYREEDALRPYFKSMYAHNTLIIDDLPHSVPSGSWDYEAFATVLKTYVKHSDQIHYFEGSIIDEQTTAIHTRKVMIIDPSIWFICDEVKIQGDHSITQYFHLDPACIYQPLECTVQHGTSHLHVDFHQQPTIHEEPCSLRYNELQPHTLLQVSDHMKDCIIMHTSMYAPHISKQSLPVYQDNTLLDKEIVSAFQYSVSSQERYQIIIFHKELFKGRKICFCEGVAFHAKSVVIHIKDGKITIHNLKC